MSEIKSGNPIFLLFEILLVLAFLSFAYDELQVFFNHIVDVLTSLDLQVLVQQHVAVTIVEFKWIESLGLKIL